MIHKTRKKWRFPTLFAISNEIARLEIEKRRETGEYLSEEDEEEIRKTIKEIIKEYNGRFIDKRGKTTILPE